MKKLKILIFGIVLQEVGFLILILILKFKKPISILQIFKFTPPFFSRN